MIFHKCATKKKKIDPIEDIPHPTLASIHHTLNLENGLPKYSITTWRTILLALGFR